MRAIGLPPKLTLSFFPFIPLFLSHSSPSWQATAIGLCDLPSMVRPQESLDHPEETAEPTDGSDGELAATPE